MYTAPSYERAHTYATTLSHIDDTNPIAFAAPTIIPDDDDDDINPTIDRDDSPIITVNERDDTDKAIDFDLNGNTTPGVIPNIVEDEEDRMSGTPAELLRYHHKLGHLPFTKLIKMAQRGCSR